MKLFYAMLLSLTLSSCTLRASITPEGDALKDATVGVSYYDEINIIGGRAFTLNSDGITERFVGSISPDNLGLYIQRCDGDEDNNNCVQIRGVPTKAGVVTVRVSGSLFGTNISSGSSFDKTFTLIVKSADGKQE